MNTLSSIDRMRMKCSSLDSSQWDELNGGKFMFLGSVDYKIFQKKYKTLNTDNLSSIDPRDMNLPPFDSPYWDESNEPCFVLIRSIDDEPPRHFWMIVKNKLLNFNVTKRWMLCLLLIVWGWDTARWIRHNEMSWMVANSCF